MIKIYKKKEEKKRWSYLIFTNFLLKIIKLIWKSDGSGQQDRQYQYSGKFQYKPNKNTKIKIACVQCTPPCFPRCVG